MRFIKRTITGWILILFFIWGCGKGSTEKPEIRFAFQNRIGSAVPIIAVEKNFFKRYGVKVIPLKFNSGPSCAEALYSGSADIGTMGDATSVIAVSRTENLMIAGSHSTGEFRHRMVVSKTSEYASLEDLKGKKIGIKKGTSTYGGFLSKIENLGLRAKDFQVIDLSPSVMPEALFSGSIDAFAASEPTPSLSETKGARELVTFGGLGNKYPILIIAKKRLTEKRAEDLALFFKGLKDAEKFIRENPQETKQILGSITGLEKEALDRAFKRHDYRINFDEDIRESLISTAVFLKKVGKIEKLPDFKTRVAAGLF